MDKEDDNDSYSLLDYEPLLNESLKHKWEPFYSNLNISQLKETYLTDEIDYVRLDSILFKSFKLFDHENLNQIDVSDLKCCLHYLNLCPSESQFLEILVELQIDPNVINNNNLNNNSNHTNRRKLLNRNKKKSKISFDEFKSALRPIVLSGLCSMKDRSILESAFKIISSNRPNNLIDREYLKDMLHSETSDKLKYEELELFDDYLKLNHPKTAHLNCEKYIDELIKIQNQNDDDENFYEINSLFKNDQYFNSNYILKCHNFKF